MVICLNKYSFATFFAILLLFTIFLAGVMTQNFKEVGLTAHNVKRALHQGLEPISLDNEAQEAAQKCAEYYTQIKKVDHSCPYRKTKYQPPYDTYGENLYTSTSKKPPHLIINKAMDKWYNEIQFWDFKTSSPKPGKTRFHTFHFTQIVWKSTKIFGIGIHTDPSYGTVVVALYGPAGNEENKYKENVFPLK